MMVAIRGHFDGKVIIPSEPVDLPQGRELVFHVDNSAANLAGAGVSGASLLRFSGAVAKDDLESHEAAHCRPLRTGQLR